MAKGVLISLARCSKRNVAVKCQVCLIAILLAVIYLQNCKPPGGAEGLFNILADIAVREPLFDRLRTAQLLDDLDIEGIWPIYKQIQSRCVLTFFCFALV